MDRAPISFAISEDKTKRSNIMEPNTPLRPSRPVTSFVPTSSLSHSNSSGIPSSSSSSSTDPLPTEGLLSNLSGMHSSDPNSSSSSSSSSSSIANAASLARSTELSTSQRFTSVHRNASNAHLSALASSLHSRAETELENVGESAEEVEERERAEQAQRDERDKGKSKVDKPVNIPSGSRRTIIVNACQRGNPMLKAIKNVGWEYGDIVPDYQVGANTCVLYLSLKYHRLHPEYLHTRIEKLKGMYLLRILLLHCDVEEHQEPIREITKICLINELTVLVAWSYDEAGTYLSTFKAFENRPPDLLKERVNKDYASQLHATLTSVRGINKTDVMTLSTNFGSFQAMTRATAEDLSLCPGLGDLKVKRLYDAFHLPFRVGASASSSKGKNKNAISKSSAPILESESESAPGSGSGSSFAASLDQTGRQLNPVDVELDDEIGRRPESTTSYAEGFNSDDLTSTPAAKAPHINSNDNIDATNAAEATDAGTAYSPDWPDEPDSQDVRMKQGETLGGGREDKRKNTWNDPLADSEEDEEDGEEEPPGKRQKAF